MEELITLFAQFNLIIREQIKLLNEFVFILDQEEDAIARYNFFETEKSVVLKNQHMKMFQAAEEKRIILMKRICYLIAFDSRDQNLSLTLFKDIFSTYLLNVKKLLDENIIQELECLKLDFFEISSEYSSVFENISNRIYRNQVILKKVILHVNMSLNLFQLESESGANYDSLGKTQSIFNQQNPASSIRVTV